MHPDQSDNESLGMQSVLSESSGTIPLYKDTSDDSDSITTGPTHKDSGDMETSVFFRGGHKDSVEKKTSIVSIYQQDEENSYSDENIKIIVHKISSDRASIQSSATTDSSNEAESFHYNTAEEKEDDEEEYSEKTALRKKLSMKRRFSLLSRNMSASLRKLSNVPEERMRHFNADVVNHGIVNNPLHWCVTTLLQKYLADIQYQHKEADTILLVYSADNAPVILPESSSELDKRVVWRSRHRRRYAIDVCPRALREKLDEYSDLKKVASSYYVDDTLLEEYWSKTLDAAHLSEDSFSDFIIFPNTYQVPN